MTPPPVRQLRMTDAQMLEAARALLDIQKRQIEGVTAIARAALHQMSKGELEEMAQEMSQELDDILQEGD